MAGGGGSISEMTGQQGQMATSLAQGLQVIDLNATVSFQLYKRMVLPSDGFVFWILASLIVDGSVDPSYSQTMTINGSLHHTTTNKQDPEENFSIHRMVFTTNTPVNDLGAIGSEYMYLGTTETEQYSFSTRSGWYEQAGLYHYSGDAVYSTLASQIIDTVDQISALQVVSNSLPIWLLQNSLFNLYPSYLVPDNLEPPFATVHIDENSTSSLQSAPYWDTHGNRWQLAKDTVIVTTYGIRNDVILDWIDSVQKYALNNPQSFGIMNSPIPKDAKRGQVEISTIAQKKIITFDVNYYQSRLNSIVQKYIESAFITTTYAPLLG